MLSDLFYVINFAFSILVSIIGLLCGLATILIIVINQPCHTVPNLLLSNVCFATSTLYINTLIASVYGFREDWALNQPLCVLRAFTFIAAGMAICYSYLTQAISRLVFVVFFKRKRLHTFRVHWYLIVSTWIISFLAPVPLLLFENGFEYAVNERLCLPSENNAPTTIFAIIVGFVLPLNLSIIIYYSIWRYTLRSSRRILPTVSDIGTFNMPNMKREMKLALNMTILLSLYGFSGMPMTIVLFWIMISPNNPPPAELYLLASNSISLFVALLTIALFIMDKQLKNTGLKYFYHAFRHINQRTNRSQT